VGERWRGGARARVVLVVAGVLIGACRGEPAPAPHASAAAAAGSAPAGDGGELCTDLASARVCWGGTCGDVGCVTARPAPPLPALSQLGWRCVGGRAERRCSDRRVRAGGFECRGDVCVQGHPRLPGDGEWLCAEAAGAVVCAGGERAAGVAAPRAEPGWFCGQRAGMRPAQAGPRAQPSALRAPSAGPRVCVDFDADFPDGVPTNWRCRFGYERGVQRVCERDASTAELGDACDAARPCVDGSRCTAGYCVPPRPAPECWLDSDCTSKVCRFGSCARPPS
jgi:hypothetical protein